MSVIVYLQCWPRRSYVICAWPARTIYSNNRTLAGPLWVPLLLAASHLARRCGMPLTLHPLPSPSPSPSTPFLLQPHSPSTPFPLFCNACQALRLLIDVSFLSLFNQQPRSHEDFSLSSSLSFPPPPNNVSLSLPFLPHQLLSGRHKEYSLSLPFLFNASLSLPFPPHLLSAPQEDFSLPLPLSTHLMSPFPFPFFCPRVHLAQAT